jgi:hypothetical protein
MFFKGKSNEGAAPAVPVLPDVAAEIAISPSLQAAVERVEMLVAAHQQIEAAFSTAKIGQEAAQRELHGSTDRLATVESATALNGGDVDRGARKAHVAARDAVEFARARVTGLESRLSRSVAALIEGKRALAGEWRNWSVQQADLLRSRYDRAAQVFLDEVATIMAGATVLGSNAGRLNSITRNIHIPHAVDPWRNSANPGHLKDRNIAEASELAQRLRAVGASVMPLIRDIADAPLAAKVEEGDAA